MTPTQHRNVSRVSRCSRMLAHARGAWLALCVLTIALPRTLHGQDRVARAGGDAQQAAISVPLEIEVLELTSAAPRGRPYLSATVSVLDNARRVRLCSDVRPTSGKWRCGSVATGSSLSVEMKAQSVGAGQNRLPFLMFNCQTSVPDKMMPGKPALLTVVRVTESSPPSTSCRW